MDEREARRRHLAAMATQSGAAADSLLDGELNALRAATRIDLDRLKPKVADSATYNQLLAVVEDSTRKNESLAQLKTRVETLGKEAVSIVKTVTTLLG